MLIEEKEPTFKYAAIVWWAVVWRLMIIIGLALALMSILLVKLTSMSFLTLLHVLTSSPAPVGHAPSPPSPQQLMWINLFHIMYQLVVFLGSILITRHLMTRGFGRYRLALIVKNSAQR